VDQGERLVAVIIEVADLDRSATLYEKAFGVTLEVGDNGGEDRWISGPHRETSWVDGAYLHFALYQAKTHERTAHAQISFRVDDLGLAHVKALDAGAELVHPPRPEPWGRSARYRDFDGNVIELTQAD
jgi:predicted enzyme related to lactoylglutathione lyase